ncbi:MAG TPA: hypothetical protein VGS21_10870 [Acidimicrobiales bacterium]|nr:hypothetical protein [Acidimicrobiales bacterium]
MGNMRALWDVGQSGDHRVDDLGRPVAGSPIIDQPPLRLSRAAKALARCVLSTGLLLAQRRLHQPRQRVGSRIRFADGTVAEVYRETAIERRGSSTPAVLVVAFRLRGVRSDPAHAAFRVESELNTVLFAGFPGLVSKLWLRHDEHGVYRGLYQWDDPELAASYARALWWVLALVSVRGSIHWTVLPGLRRDCGTPAW